MDAAPEPIQRGLSRLAGVSGATVVSAPEFIPTEGAWAIELLLSQTHSSEFVPEESRWILLVDHLYPSGRIRLYPGLSDSIAHTFPHQDRNVGPQKDGERWRTGKPCLDSPSQRLGRVAGGPEPKTDAEERLRWHVERCLSWLDLAATEQLMVDSEPFEVPQCPSELLNKDFTVVHDEGPDTYSAWSGRTNRFGEVWWGGLPGFEKTIVAETFLDTKGDTFRTCRRGVSDTDKPWVGYWWIWPAPVVVPPWHAPGTWAELRQTGARLKVDVDGFIRWLARRAAGEEAVIVLIGYEIPSLWNGPTTEVHWQAIMPPTVPRKIKPMNGFRDNDRGRSERLRRDIFVGNKKLSYLKTSNWHPNRLQARGRFSATFRDRPVAVIGAGALGSAVAELLVRGGVGDILIIDHDLLEIGNLVRHTLTGGDLGKNKAARVAARLQGAAPMAKVSAVEKQLPQGEALRSLLERFDVVIDCTGEDEVLRRLAGAWWSMPRLFLSASMGFAAHRLFLFEARGCSFPVDGFLAEVAPWIEGERSDWSAAGETLEGAGCWSPLFPARSDDVWLAAVATVKHLERSMDGEPQVGLTVLEQLGGPGVGFQIAAEEGT